MKDTTKVYIYMKISNCTIQNLEVGHSSSYTIHIHPRWRRSQKTIKRPERKRGDFRWKRIKWSILSPEVISLYDTVNISLFMSLVLPINLLSLYQVYTVYIVHFKTFNKWQFVLGYGSINLNWNLLTSKTRDYRRFLGTAEKTLHGQGLESVSVEGTVGGEGEDPLLLPGVRPLEVGPGLQPPLHGGWGRPSPSPSAASPPKKNTQTGVKGSFQGSWSYGCMQL